MPIAQAIGNFQAQVILSIFYILIFSPLAIVFKIFADPLQLRWKEVIRQKTNFQNWQHQEENLEEARKQY